MSKLRVPTVKEMIANNERPEILFWVGCAGSFDDRAKKISKAIVRILNYCNIKFAILGPSDKQCRFYDMLWGHEYVPRFNSLIIPT